MEILRWYGIFLISLGFILSFILIIGSNEPKERLKNFLGIVFQTPILIYLILS